MADEDDKEGSKGLIEPEWRKKFNVVDITKDIENITKNYFMKNPVYSPEDGTSMSQEISKLVRDGIMYSKGEKLKMPRYKTSCQVFLGQRKDQKISVIAKGYWDTYVDNYATYTYLGNGFYCTVLVLGFYTD